MKTIKCRIVHVGFGYLADPQKCCATVLLETVPSYMGGTGKGVAGVVPVVVVLPVGQYEPILSDYRWQQLDSEYVVEYETTIADAAGNTVIIADRVVDSRTYAKQRRTKK